jgi:hypothetical protein
LGRLLSGKIKRALMAEVISFLINKLEKGLGRTASVRCGAEEGNDAHLKESATFRGRCLLALE